MKANILRSFWCIRFWDSHFKSIMRITFISYEIQFVAHSAMRSTTNQVSHEHSSERGQQLRVQNMRSALKIIGSSDPDKCAEPLICERPRTSLIASERCLVWLTRKEFITLAHTHTHTWSLSSWLDGSQLRSHTCTHVICSIRLELNVLCKCAASHSWG